MNNELIADIFEALELLKKWKSLYEVILKNTKDKKQALEAIQYIINLDN